MATPSLTYPRLTGLGAERLVVGPWRIAVTGAGGWLGLATLELLHLALGADFERRVVCFGSSRRVLHLRDGLEVSQKPLSELGREEPSPSLLLHLAYLTQDMAKGMTAVDYEAANRAISSAVLEALDGLGVEGVFLASSGAARMADDPAADPSKRLYGRLKVEDEARFAVWAERSGGRAAIARIFALSGPYINKPGAYALASFIDDALDGRPPTVRAPRPVYRSWVAISELMSVVFGVLTDPKACVERFDTAGAADLEMADAAWAVARALSRPGEVDRAPIVDPVAERYCGDLDAYASLIGRYSVQRVAFDEQVRHTARYMAESRGGAGHCEERSR